MRDMVQAAVSCKYPEASIIVQRKEPADSRPARFTEEQQLVDDAKSEFETLRDELQEWHDNLPENLQDGEKANQLDEAIQGLEEVINQCEEVTGAGVEIPGMF